MSQWFYMQQWRAIKRVWAQVGETMPFPDAKEVYSTLTTRQTESDCTPLALLQKEEEGRVVTDKDDVGDWYLVSANDLFIQVSSEAAAK